MSTIFNLLIARSALTRGLYNSMSSTSWNGNLSTTFSVLSTVPHLLLITCNAVFQLTVSSRYNPFVNFFSSSFSVLVRLILFSLIKRLIVLLVSALGCPVYRSMESLISFVIQSGQFGTLPVRMLELLVHPEQAENPAPLVVA